MRCIEMPFYLELLSVFFVVPSNIFFEFFTEY